MIKDRATALKAALSKIFSRPRFSLKGRLWFILATLVFFALGFCFFLIYGQDRIASRGVQMAIFDHEQLAIASEMWDTLAAIDRDIKAGESIQSSKGLAKEVGRFESLLQQLVPKPESPAESRVIRELGMRFNRFAVMIAQSGPYSENKKQAYEDVAVSLGTFLGLNRASVYRHAETLWQNQRHGIQATAMLLISFIVFLLLAGMELITVVTLPISGLSRFMDRVDMEEDLPSQLPKFKPEIPEISILSRSFERLLQRLRGYRAINVSRLLGEKRRADIIAASISDGIFLLRGDEIIYLNPIAEKILGGGFELGKGARLGGLDLKKRPGAQAVLTAASRTIPVEFSLEIGDRRLSFLIQSHPITDDLIEKVQHSVGDPVEEALGRFQADTVVLAQDVTLVRESQNAKGHFLATLSHEIKTPVTSLTMATRLLKKSIDEIPNPTHRSLILTCAEDVDRMRLLLEDLLTISRLNALTQRIEVQNIDLAKLLRHSIQSFQGEASEKGIELTIDFQKDRRATIVPMDPTKIAWALSNLLINALRHTPKGGKVTAGMAIRDEWVEISVKDSGPGIERARQERIFEKFNPHYDLRIARTGSVGAGLAIAREIVAAHGGRIWVNSEQGHGAEFCFTLPLRGRAVEPAEPPEELKPRFATMKGAIRGTSARS